MSSPVEQIKDKLDIATIVGSYIKLERQGGVFRAKCPFHQEKTPSFMVSPDRGTYHCFGCNKGGDIFSFVEEIEGTDFPGALRVLADRAGVVLTRENPSERNERDRLYALLNDVTIFFRKELRTNNDAKKYLVGRGLTPSTIDEFQIGFAPNDWHSAENYLRGKGYTENEMEKTGMSIRGEKGIYDRFRSRIMFPICDSAGRVVGFTGRVFQSDDPAKYVNSPETALYNKSKILFGLSQAKSSIRESGSAILVEGQMDLIMAHQAGTKNTVAVSGTALTGFQLEMLKRFADKLLFSFDSDTAGLAAARKSAIPALKMGFDVHAIELGEEKDPADLILESPDKWFTAISSSRHIIEFFLSVLQKKSKDKREFRHSVEKSVLPIVASIESKIDQAHFADIVATFLDVPRDVVMEEVRRVAVAGDIEYATIATEEKSAVPVKKTPSTRREAVERKLKGVILWQQSATEPLMPIEEVVVRYQEISGTDYAVDESEHSALIYEAEAFYHGTSLLQAEVAELLMSLEKEIIKEAQEETMKELLRAQLLHNTEQERIIFGKFNELAERLKKLNVQ